MRPVSAFECRKVASEDRRDSAGGPSSSAMDGPDPSSDMPGPPFLVAPFDRRVRRVANAQSHGILDRIRPPVADHDVNVFQTSRRSASVQHWKIQRRFSTNCIARSKSSMMNAQRRRICACTLCEATAHFTTLNSIRRLRARPSSLPLSATGRSCPWPMLVRLAASTPCSINRCFTASARSCDSFTSAAASPLLSVWPPISMRVPAGDALIAGGGLGEDRVALRGDARAVSVEMDHHQVQRMHQVVGGELARDQQVECLRGRVDALLRGGSVAR